MTGNASGPQRGGCGEQALIISGTAATCALLLALWLIGPEHLRTLATIVVVAVSVAVVLVGVAVVVRMWRRKDVTGETVTNHYYHEGTKTVVRERVLDGRAVEAPKLYQLPAQGGGAAFPELLRASYAAGMLAQRGQAGSGRPAGAGNEATYPEWQEIALDGATALDESTPEGWDGDIR